MQNSMRCASSLQASTSTKSVLCERSSFVGKQLSFNTGYSQQRQQGVFQVVAKGGQGRKQARQMKQMGAAQGGPPIPAVDPNNVEFVIFIKPAGESLSGWLPVTVVKGGGTANSLVAQFESKWGRTLMGKTLIRNIAQSLYRDNKSLEKQMRSQAGIGWKNVTEFQYAFKIRDKTQPKDWLVAEDLTMIPPERELGTMPLEALRKRLTGK